MERNKKIQLEIFQVWGYLVKVQDPISKRIKIGPMTVDCKIRLEQSREGSKNPRNEKDNVLNKKIQRLSKMLKDIYFLQI